MEVLFAEDEVQQQLQEIQWPSDWRKHLLCMRQRERARGGGGGGKWLTRCEQKNGGKSGGQPVYSILLEELNPGLFLHN